MTPPDPFAIALARAQQTLDRGFDHLPPFTPPPLSAEALAILDEAAERMHDNYPYHHPLYAGQMLKPPHPVARAAYAMAMSVNPNNHALDGGRASSRMELEAVAEIAEMFRLPQHLGHLSSSGTFANLEALWVAGQLQRNPDGRPRAIAASAQAHYTHHRISAALALPFVELAVDATNRIDLTSLERLLEARAAAGDPIGTVVVTLGTTATGAVDPLDQIVRLRERFGFRVHVDGAYGGYFMLARTLDPAARAAYDAIPEADSVVVDPHKHGLQPYGCGCVLFRDPAVGALYRHDCAFTYFTSAALHLGEISLECSRAGASAVALWSTLRLLPLTPGGTFASMLEQCRANALELTGRLRTAPAFVLPAAPPQLDIVVWAVAATTPAESSALAQQVFDQAAAHDLHLALATLPIQLFQAGAWPGAAPDATVLCLRSVLMKPEHGAWMDEIWTRLLTSAAAVVLPEFAVLTQK